MLKDFKSVKSLCEKNKHRKVSEWLRYKTLFANQGKQGITGILETVDCSKQIVFKISQDINYTSEHEYTVMDRLNSIAPFCPHFCKSIGLLDEIVEPRYRKNDNPFQIKSVYGINKKILLIEYIKNCYKLYNYIKSKDFSEEILYSIIKQVLLALKIAQKKVKFTHYDLHSCNIMIKKCDKDLQIMYVIDKENVFIVPTYGYYPVIIDYGFSYVDDMENAPLYPSLGHTQVGFNSFTFDSFADPKLFLVTVSDEIFQKRHTRKSKLLKRIVHNMFKNLKIDWRSGWDCFEKESASDYIGRLIKTFDSKSRLFNEYEFYCIDIIQSLIILPLEKQNYSNIEKSYNAFIREWFKIENNISNVYYNLYILKKMVNSARIVRPDYLNPECKQKAVIKFKKDVYLAIDEVTSFCNPTDINFELMLCALYVLSNCFEGIMYDTTQSTLHKKQMYYNNLPITSLEEIYTILEVNIPSNTVITKQTKMLVLDSDKEESFVYDFDKLDDESINIINTFDNIIKGNIVLNVMKK